MFSLKTNLFILFLCVLIISISYIKTLTVAQSGESFLNNIMPSRYSKTNLGLPNKCS
jgi:hypothetical protein